MNYRLFLRHLCCSLKQHTNRIQTFQCYYSVEGFVYRWLITLLLQQSDDNTNLLW